MGSNSLKVAVFLLLKESLSKRIMISSCCAVNPSNIHVYLSGARRLFYLLIAKCFTHFTRVIAGIMFAHILTPSLEKKLFKARTNTTFMDRSQQHAGKIAVAMQ